MLQVTGVCSVALGHLASIGSQGWKTHEIPGTSQLNKNRDRISSYITLCRLSFKWDKLSETLGEGNIGMVTGLMALRQL